MQEQPHHYEIKHGNNHFATQQQQDYAAVCGLCNTEYPNMASIAESILESKNEMIKRRVAETATAKRKLNRYDGPQCKDADQTFYICKHCYSSLLRK